ncbi:hypothetical protein [Kitasatospora sp. MAP5-34]|uniref:hypothetical protein n=1 Tax=Kitasatospora sp. MAP5-34 TaxID=3035102 RepID=UPI002475ED12|nr:hypothetical protein [Kitasatospora sp. MAP5-34]MDH6575539.1 hypothetical protein [Kitasatospora sp. MAP5-34]
MAGPQPGPDRGSYGTRVTERPGSPPADPVRELMEQHRALCERAVDVLEIAAGLEDSGIGPAEAARYRHVDVFALAEELYARVPRRPPEAGPPPHGTSWRQRAGRALRSTARHWLPCAVLAAVLVATRALPPVIGLLASAVCGGRLVRVAAGRWALPQLGYGVGVALLLVLPLRAPAPEAALGLAAALGMGSVEWAVGWLGHAARGHLGSARTLAEYRARMRPALPVAILLHLAVLSGLCFAALAVLTELAPRPGPAVLHQAALRASGTQWAGAAALGLLLVSAAVLRLGGRAGPAGAGLLAAGAGSVLLTAAGSAPATAQLFCCGAVVALLLPYASVVLGRPETGIEIGIGERAAPGSGTGTGTDGSAALDSRSDPRPDPPS